MQDPAFMAVCHSGKELQHKCLDFRLQERRRHDTEQSLEVMFDEVHDNEHSDKESDSQKKLKAPRDILGQRVSDNHLPYAHHVLVFAYHQCIDFSQRCDWKPMLLLL